MNETRVKKFSVKNRLHVGICSCKKYTKKVEMKVYKGLILYRLMVHGEETQEEYPTYTVYSMHLVVSEIDIGYSSCLSSPPSICIRLVFCTFISTLLLYFLQLHPYMQFIFNRKIFYHSILSMHRKGSLSITLSTLLFRHVR